MIDNSPFMTKQTAPGGTPDTWAVPLRETGLGHLAEVGRKAAVLADLLTAGFRVPHGVVLTTTGIRDADDSWNRGLADLVAADLGRGPFAVRSSGVDEDGRDASYAGLFETRLNVVPERIGQAIAECVASARSERVLAYRGSGTPARLAVLIQQQVPADAAGVAFTADPVTGDRTAVRVSAVRGLGERLVSGESSPDEWVVRAGAAQTVRITESAVDERIVLAVADLARRVEQHFGTPQDIEWAWVEDSCDNTAGGGLYLLQARPITALPDQAATPIPVPIEPPPGFWEREATHAPKPWSPMLGSVFFKARNDGLRAMFDQFGFLVETLEFREIGGWDYMRLVPVGGKDRPAPPAFLLPFLVRAIPMMRKRLKRSERSVREDDVGRIVERWYTEWQGEMEGRSAVLRDLELADLDDAQLRAHTANAARLLDDGVRIHFLLHGAIAMTLADLAFTCNELLGWDDAAIFELLAGLSVRSTLPAHDLAELADLVRHRPAVREALRQVDSGSTARLRAIDPEFGRALDSYTTEHGHRALRYDIADPALAEVPTLTLRLLADQVDRGYDPDAEIAALARRRTETAAGARGKLASKPPADRDRFERALARAERAYPVREDNESLTFSVPLALLRYAVLEIARRLVDRRRLSDIDDVFFLTLPQAMAALDDPSATGLRDVVARRRGERSWIEQHPGPASYGKQPPPPPPFDALPEAARFLNRALVWTVTRIFEADASNRSGVRGEVSGIAASPGRYTGPVRVVMDEFEFDKIKPGDVLVCPVTSPVWSVLFPSIGALVTDTGGLLSHPAIIAREYRVPAVVATANATTVLKDGQIVTVDGSSGRVDLHG